MCRHQELGVMLFAQSDVIKIWPVLFAATSLQRRVARCQFYNFVEFIAKTEEFVVIM